MATTIWKFGSGDWNDAANWTNGVPTAEDRAIFPTDSPPVVTDGNGHDVLTVTGAGPVGFLEVLSASVGDPLLFTGAHSVGAISSLGGPVDLASNGSLSFAVASFTGPNGTDVLTLDAGATLGVGTIDLENASLQGTFGLLSNPLQLSGTDVIAGTGSLAGSVAGVGSLKFGDVFNSSSGSVTVAGNASGYSGAVEVQTSSLTLSAGESGLNTLTADEATITATSQNLLVFDSTGATFLNGSGHSTVVGAVGPTFNRLLEIPPEFGTLSVNGGTGSVTVFGNDDSGAIFGGSAGGNVIVAGASALGYVSLAGSAFYSGPVGRILAPGGATIVGGGNGDLLVATGRFANLIAAAGGNETLNGAAATGADTFFGGTGADEIAAGTGQNTIVAGTGAETIFGSSGSTAIFTGAGSDLIVGGTGADYIQEGRGTAEVYAGSGFTQIGVVNGQSGGSMAVTGFKPDTDQIQVQGYASGPAITVAGGNTILTFSDNTRLTLIGVTNLPVQPG